MLKALKKSASSAEVAAPAKAPHRVAVLLTVIVFPLIWFGGLVTSWDAGMAVPDWPGTFGYNMFAYPISTWFFGPWDLFVEHGHRLLASISGLVAIGLMWFTFKNDSRKWVR
jgi:cytochrome c oxidase assembly protein subunit 15